ncbi:MAG: universal stress protein [Pseudomonadota bacterium]|nr:universal stress protein [Pseudomonadota bacterium]
MITRILVPFDGSAPARAALAYARLIASPGATVILVYVLPVRDLLDALGVGRAAERDARALLLEAAATFPTAQIHLPQGDPAQEIAAEGARVGADLIILGSRGRSLLSGLVLGSTARSLLHAATVPLLVVHEPIGALTSIVAAVEAGDASVRVARSAQELAAATGARVTLVNVVDADPAVVATPDQYGIPDQVWRDAVATHAERVFAPLRSLVPGASEALAYGRATDELPDAVKAYGAQVIVVARRGGSGIGVEAWTSVAATLAVRGPFATLVV